MSYTYTYPRPAVTVDAVVFRRSAPGISVLLIERRNDPFKGYWALPGGFVDMEETLEEAVSRELAEETGLKNIELEQLQAFSAIGRDPRGRTISVVFWGILQNDLEPVSGDDAAEARWFNINNLPNLAFDHDEVLQLALKKLNEQ